MLTFIGGTAGARFRDNVAKLQESGRAAAGACGRVSFAGELDDEEMAAPLDLSAALVMSSPWEGFGLSALESKSCAVPALASERGNRLEAAGDGGLCFDPATGNARRRCDPPPDRAGPRRCTSSDAGASSLSKYPGGPGVKPPALAAVRSARIHPRCG
ncbi:glycosyltransferase [Albidovulum sp.]|uniref:glycosyltransferase n=1 Tax=Albidovulum sp. TaxID=1872424 RepID=UPI003D7D844F